MAESPLITGAEDFTFYQRATPGVFLILGDHAARTDRQGGRRTIRRGSFVDERALITGVRALAHLAADYLFRRRTRQSLVPPALTP